MDKSKSKVEKKQEIPEFTFGFLYTEFLETSYFYDIPETFS